ncbi:MAG: amidohydrolase family protein [Gammaproteobacteria bacterium]|jgi:imidazolonepropionase-like amidohydrolase|nr:amidohydrolase family protein [Gammaproteobacteria bacterium]MBT5542529.1 amidohydrolase family protein [Gammaproteobacteria bacterium]MBT7753798.1 amidohydrolase family protein [Gammaproteobacteria bacterium]
MFFNLKYITFVYFYLMILMVSSPLHSEITIIHAGTLIDGQSNQAYKKRTIIIEDTLIVSVINGYQEPQKNDIYLDLKKYTVLPGLMDMHVHLDGEYNKNSYSERFSFEAADRAIRAVVNAKKTLMAGFTTVRNLGDSDNVTISLRNAINQGIISGPRIFSAGKSLATTGGHADPTNGVREDIFHIPTPVDGVIDGRDGAFKGVRSRYQSGADLIKITATGGVLSVAKNGQNPQFTEDEILAIVEAAKDYDFTVAAHAHGAEGIKRAVRAGVNSIEHGSLMDEEGMSLMVKYGTYYVPTIMAGYWVAEKAQQRGFFPEIVRPKALAIGPAIQETFRKAYERGVKIAFGTDSGVSAHGENAQEFIYMVQAGMSEMEAIKSATSIASELIGMSDLMGSIQSGKLADIIAVSGNPLEDISTLKKVEVVIKEGVIYKN